MFELLIGSEATRRQVSDRVHKVQRGDDGERRSRIRAVFAAAGRGAGSVRKTPRTAAAPRTRSSAADCR